jgi:hypothetical protein
MSVDPYRSPEVPAGAQAERRLRERAAARMAEAAVDRERRRRRRLRLERAVLWASLLALAYVALAVTLRLTVYEWDPPSWLDASLLVAGIGTPMSFFFALGMKVPPREGDPFGGLPRT